MRQSSALAIADEIALAQQRRLDAMPEDQKALGKILRTSVITGDMGPLAAYLEEREIVVARERLAQFRDYLILSRFDLKDLEPDARSRLRELVLDIENPLLKSADYRRAEATGSIPRCRGCAYFVNPPDDGSSDGDKACTHFGAKGSDIACFGFKSKVG